MYPGNDKLLPPPHFNRITVRACLTSDPKPYPHPSMKFVMFRAKAFISIDNWYWDEEGEWYQRRNNTPALGLLADMKNRNALFLMKRKSGQVIFVDGRLEMTTKEDVNYFYIHADYLTQWVSPEDPPREGEYGDYYDVRSAVHDYQEPEALQ